MPAADLATLSQAAELFKALSAPTRLAVLSRLADGPACVHELVAELGVAQPLLSQHLRVLRAADLVRGQRRGREIAYELADQHVARLVDDAVAHARELTSGRTPAPLPTLDPTTATTGISPDPAVPSAIHPTTHPTTRLEEHLS